MRAVRRKRRSKSVHFDGGGGGRSDPARNVLVPASTSSLSGYVKQVQRTLGGRTDDYHELVDIVTELGQAAAAAEGDDAATEVIVSLMERTVAVLHGRTDLIAGLRMFLPPQYQVDIQPDAIIFKV